MLKKIGRNVDKFGKLGKFRVKFVIILRKMIRKLLGEFGFFFF